VAFCFAFAKVVLNYYFAACLALTGLSSALRGAGPEPNFLR
jgi:hypothetical protein